MASRPNTSSFRQIPIASFSGVDNNLNVQGILRTMEYGNFNSAAIFGDQLLTDDRISGVMETRSGALLAAPVDMRPAGDSAQEQEIAEEIGGTDESNAGLWDDLVPDYAVSELLRWGQQIGIGVAEIVWKGSPGKVRPRLKIWHPQFVYWNWGTFSYWIITGDGVVELPRVDEQPRSDGKWIVWTPRGYQGGWFHGLIRSLARLYLMRQWDWRDWARYNEKYGQPLTKGTVPAGASETIKENFKIDLIQAGSDGVVIVEEGLAQGKSYDVSMVESAGKTGWNSFQAFLSEINSSIAIRILGQNDTTEAKGGSNARAQVMERVSLLRRKEDARIGRVFRQQLLTWYAEFNYGDPDLAPTPVYQVDPPEDVTQVGMGLKALGDGLAAMKLGGAAIDVRAIVDEQGYPQLTEAEEAASKAEAFAQAQAIAEKSQPPGTSDPNAASAKKPPPSKTKPAGLSALPMPVARMEFRGIPIAVENPKGTIRVWHSDDGKQIGATTMLADYGYIEGQRGSDKEELDCYVGDDENAAEVYVIHQLAAPDFESHDEDKIFLGMPSADAAKACFLSHRNDGDRSYGGMTSFPFATFVRKLQTRTGMGKIRATADTSDATALRATKTASRYTLDLEDKTAKRAAAAMKPDLVKVHAAISAATSFENLRERLVKTFKGMNPKDLADLTAKARIMAHLAGRGEILEQL